MTGEPLRVREKSFLVSKLTILSLSSPRLLPFRWPDLLPLLWCCLAPDSSPEDLSSSSDIVSLPRLFRDLKYWILKNILLVRFDVDTPYFCHNLKSFNLCFQDSNFRLQILTRGMLNRHAISHKLQFRIYFIFIRVCLHSTGCTILILINGTYKLQYIYNKCP